MTSSLSVTEPAAPAPGDGGLVVSRPDVVRVRVRLDIAYDGTAFAGWAVQPGQRTVAGELMDALATILRTPVHLTVAGRTDAGVHAVGQVAHLDLEPGVWAASARTLVRSLGGVLPREVRVRSVRAVPRDFHARYSALSRTYLYRVAHTDWGVDPLRRLDTVHWSRPLALEAMRAASKPLLGLHDFAAYCKRSPTGTTIRTLQRFAWTRRDDGVLEADVRGDAFCHSMVRSLVGAVLAVGDRRRPVTWPASLLSLGHRSDRVIVAPALGLTLVAVAYPPDDQFAERNKVTRAVRTT